MHRPSKRKQEEYGVPFLWGVFWISATGIVTLFLSRFIPGGKAAQFFGTIALWMLLFSGTLLMVHYSETIIKRVKQ